MEPGLHLPVGHTPGAGARANLLEADGLEPVHSSATAVVEQNESVLRKSPRADAANRRARREAAAERSRTMNYEL